MLYSTDTNWAGENSLFVPYAKTQEEIKRPGHILGSEEASGAGFEGPAVIHSPPHF